MSTLSLINVSVRDIPVSGLVVRLLLHDPSGVQGAPIYLEPSEAAEVAARLIAAADEAVHESRARRRVTPRSEPDADGHPLGRPAEPPRLLRPMDPDPYGLGFDPFRL